MKAVVQACRKAIRVDYAKVKRSNEMVALVENMAKKNRSRFLIAVLLTTLICSQETIAYLFFWFTN
jgi:hypothetical protein